MALTTLADLIVEFGEKEILELSDRDLLGVVDQTIIDHSIARADAEILSYISRRVPVIPFPIPAPSYEKLLGLANDITRYFLYNDVPTELVLARYQFALAWLRDFAAGRSELPGITDIPPTTGVDPQDPYLIASLPIFTDENLNRLTWPPITLPLVL